MRLRADPLPLATVRDLLDRFSAKLYSTDSAEMKTLLQEAVPEYTPSLRVSPPVSPTN